MNDLALRMREARVERGYSQDRLARLVGVRQQSINDIEQGRTRQPRRIVQIAHALEVSPEWLLYGRDGVPGTVLDGELVLHVMESLDKYLQDSGAAVSIEKKSRLIRAIVSMAHDRYGTRSAMDLKEQFQIRDFAHLIELAI